MVALSQGSRLAVASMLVAAPFASYAVEFDMGPVQGQFDTTVSMGATFRMEDPSDGLVGIANGGTARTVNEDDGNLGFEKGDVVSAVAKATHELEFKWREVGLFSRFSYFYDPVAADAKDRGRRFPGGDTSRVPTAGRKQGDFELGERGRDRLESDFDLLDLFAYANFNLLGHKTSIRFGNQVVNWGESTFITNSINSINPVDVARLRSPGAELKEALLPTPMFWGSFQISNSLSAELVYLTSYRETEIDPRGSFFSTNDTVSDDGNKVVTSFGRRYDDNHVFDPDDPADAGDSFDPAAAESAWLPRMKAPKMDDEHQQYGVALRYFSEALNNTDFGLFYLKHHSRTPLLSAIKAGTSAPGNGVTNAALLAAGTPTCADAPTSPVCRATYYVEYPENIELFGLSFNTDGPLGIAVQGEYSYRPNQPIQISGAEIVMAALGVPNTVTSQAYVDHDADAATAEVPAAFLLPGGTVIKGYDRVKFHQAQTTLTKAFGPSLGATQLTGIAEFGATYMELDKDQVYAGPGAALPAPGSGGRIPPNPLVPDGQPDGGASNGPVQTEGFADRFSWGYRLVGVLTFENAIGPGSLSPRMVFSHDVNGVSPTFNQETMALSLGLSFNYLQRWQADVGYTAFFGGRDYSGNDVLPAPAGSPNSQSTYYSTSANPLEDRDFLAVSVSYAF